MIDPYKVLELPLTADEETIRRRYLELVRRFPPDRDPQKFAEIRSAYEALRDRDERLRKQLFQGDRDAHLDTVVEEIACRAGRRRVSLGRLLSILDGN
jgi:curved DNA-binding protein CbpA